MLHLLHIENIAVIEEADITFSPGFNALTGEQEREKVLLLTPWVRCWGSVPAVT